MNMPPSSNPEFKKLLNILRSPTIRDIDFSHWYDYVSIIVSEWESLVEDFPESSVFQIKFLGVVKFTMQYNLKNLSSDRRALENKEVYNNSPRGFRPGWIEKFSKECINNKNYYYIVTSAKGYNSPSIEIYFDNIEIAFLGTKEDIDRIEEGNLFLSNKGKTKILWKKEIER